uniref:Uncharacterized protein n=1 Tax=Anguilla anguilla TaxID=7936 RepID=A0A0E9QKY2_ANGAN
MYPGQGGGWSLSQRALGERNAPWTGRQSIAGHIMNV